jgi:hypothetical protein
LRLEYKKQTGNYPVKHNPNSLTSGLSSFVDPFDFDLVKYPDDVSILFENINNILNYVDYLEELLIRK